MIRTVLEALRGGERTLLAADEAHLLELVGADARHLYEARPVELDVVFLLEPDPGDPDYYVGPTRAFSSYEGARAACSGRDDGVVVWEIEGDPADRRCACPMWIDPACPVHGKPGPAPRGIL